MLNIDACGTTAPFASRNELISWLREDFNINISKVEQCANGAMYLQICDRLLAGKVPMSKVNWGLKLEYEFIKNYKLLQEIFARCGLKKNIEIDKLCKGRYQDNLEFLQWMKYFYDRNAGGTVPYDAVGRRGMGQGSRTPSLDWLRPLSSIAMGQCLRDEGRMTRQQSSENTLKSRSANPRTMGYNPSHQSENIEKDRFKPMAIPATYNSASMMRVNNRGDQDMMDRPVAPVIPGYPLLDISRDDNFDIYKASISDIATRMDKLWDYVDMIESERDFYYKKLRELEILCEEYSKCDTMKVADVTEILYAEEDSETELSDENNIAPEVECPAIA